MSSAPAATSNSLATQPKVAPIAFIALSLAAFGSGVSQRVTDPLLPRMASEFSVTLAAASWVVTLFTIGYGCNQLFFGPLGDRFGKYRVIAWATVACSVATLLCAAAPNFNLLLAARLIAGSMAAAIIPLAMAWIGDVVPYEERQPVLARFLIGQILGVAAGQLLGGIAADYLNWQVPFLLIAAGFAGVSFLLFATQRQLPPHALAARASTINDGHAIERMFREFAEVLKKPWARVVVMTVFLEGACVFGGFAFFATHLHTVHGLALSTSGMVVMLFGFGGFLFASASATFVRQLGETGLARVGGMLLFVSMLVLAVAPRWQWAIPACFMTGLGFYMLHNTLQTNATQMAPERRGAAVSAFAAAYFIGQSCGVALAGLGTAYIGTDGVIMAGGIGVMLVAINFARLKARTLGSKNSRPGV